MASNSETVRGFIECIKAGDIAGALSLFAPTIVVHVPAGLPWSGEIRGLGELQGLIKKRMEAAEVTIEGYDVTDCGSSALLELTATFKAHVTGASTRARVVELYEVEDGRITSVDVYYKNPKAIADLFGPAHST